jgi:glycine cleavage system H protein
MLTRLSSAFCRRYSLSASAAEKRFLPSHEWIEVEGIVATVGISEHAAAALEDIVFVDLPDVGRAVEAGEACAELESVKAVSQIYAPVAGQVSEVNDDAAADTTLISEHAEADGWLFKMSVGADVSLDSLLDRVAYDAHVEAEKDH